MGKSKLASEQEIYIPALDLVAIVMRWFVRSGEEAERFKRVSGARWFGRVEYERIRARYLKAIEAGKLRREDVEFPDESGSQAA